MITTHRLRCGISLKYFAEGRNRRETDGVRHNLHDMLLPSSPWNFEGEAPPSALLRRLHNNNVWILNVLCVTMMLLVLAQLTPENLRFVLAKTECARLRLYQYRSNAGWVAQHGRLMRVQHSPWWDKSDITITSS